MNVAYLLTICLCLCQLVSAFRQRRRPFLLRSYSQSSTSLDLRTFTRGGKGDPCFEDVGKSRRKAKACVPKFVNAAFGLSVETSSTCGRNPDKALKSCLSSSLTGACDVCDVKNNPNTEQFLTDLHNPSNITCWHSPPLTKDENVTLKVSFKKKYELTYVSLHFCHAKPQHMAIYKSMDHGITWQPFQYYSKDCRFVFGRKRRVPITRANEQEALCLNDHLTKRGSATRIAFSTLADRPSSENFETSPVLQDWVTATDIKVVFPSVVVADDESNEVVNDDAFSSTTTRSVVSNKTTNWVGISDFAVGGRCKCNGHSSECIIDQATGETICDCKHNTAGKECEKCKSFHFDRPWGRATTIDANECRSCNCNSHARRCRFNMDLYQLSGGITGGVCLRCRHNTAGRYCHYCKEGYYRHPKRAINSRKACEVCNCHEIGAAGKICNQTNGQCPCKDGVTGLECNRCAQGYQQSGSRIAPCIKVPPPVIAIKTKTSTAVQSVAHRPQYTYQTYHRSYGYSKRRTDDPPAADECAECEPTSLRVQMRKYCSMDYVYLMTVIRKEHEDSKWTRFKIQIKKRYRHVVADKKRPLYRGQESSLWVRTRSLKCRCPRIHPGKSYLLLDQWLKKWDGVGEGKGLVIKRKTLVIEWKKEWRRRMKRFKKRSRKYCSENTQDGG